MTLPAVLGPPDRAAPAPRARRALAAAATVLTCVSIAVFAVLSASGDRAIVAPIGPAGPYADLHHHLAPALVKAACWLAAAAGGAGVLTGLAAARRGWRPRPGLVLAACAAAAAVFVFVPPAASVDVQNYAVYGRIVTLGHNPWVMTPQQLYQLHDPVGLLRPPEWRAQPTVYGPAATAAEAAAAWLGGASMAWITFWIKVMNGACYVAVAAVLDRLAGPDPARRARAALLWAVNPLMLFWMVAGAHTDLLAVLPLMLALLAGRALRRPRAGGRPVLAAAAAGALAGIAIAVKVTFAGPVAGLAAGLATGLRHAAGRRRTALLAAGIAAGTLVLAAGYAVAGRAALRSLSQRLSSTHDSFLPLPGFVYHHPALYAGVTLAAFLVAGGVLAWRMPPAHPALPEVRPMLVCALAVVLGDIVQYPWYDAMFFPLLALLPASRLDTWLVGRIVLISGLLLPGVGISTAQYREARVAVPAFLACFLVAAALGKLGRPPADPLRSLSDRHTICPGYVACQGWPAEVRDERGNVTAAERDPATPGDGEPATPRDPLAGPEPDPLAALPEGSGALLTGAFDVHVHGQPDLSAAVKNRGDDLAVIRLAHAYGIRGWVLKSHLWITTDRAALLQREAAGLGFTVYGSITLNPPMGGVSATVVELAAAHGARVVFLPTWGSAADVGRDGYVSRLLGQLSPAFSGYAAKNAISLITPSGALSGECREVIDACRGLNLALATGHASLEESRAVAAYCAQVGQRLLITHPLHYTQDPGELRRFTELGAFVEFCNAPLIHPDSHLSVRDVHEAMSALGPDRIVLTTDAFSRWAPPEPECLRMFTEQLAYLGWQPAQLRQMTADNPRAFLGITSAAAGS